MKSNKTWVVITMHCIGGHLHDIKKNYVDNHDNDVDGHLMLDVEHVSHFQARGWRRQRGSNLKSDCGILITMCFPPERFQHDDDDLMNDDGTLTLDLFVVSECLALPAWNCCSRHMGPLQIRISIN